MSATAPTTTKKRKSKKPEAVHTDAPGEMPADLKDAGWVLKEHVDEAGSFKCANPKLKLSTNPAPTAQLAIEAARRIQDMDKSGKGNGSAQAEESESAVAPTPVSRKFTRPLDVKLMDGELLAKLDELAAKLVKKEEVEDELKNVSAGYKGQIKTLRQEIHDITKAVTTKTEEREVECEERMNFTASTVEVVRLDTLEVVESRAMTLRERQRDMFATSL